MITGTRVRHPVLGDGVVMAVIPRGRTPGAQVDFGYLVDWVPQEELAQAGHLPVRPSEEQPAGEASVEGEKSPAHWKSLDRLTEDVVAARRAILALKLGQVLRENVLDLSVGTENPEALLKKAVAAAARREPAAIVVSGPYGAGKTHLLTMLAALADRERFAVASAILDGEGVTLADPMTMLEPVLRSLRFPGESVPSGIGRRLVDLRRRSDRGDGGLHRRSRIAGALFQMPVAALDDPDVLEALEAYLTTSLPASHANKTLRKLVRRSVYLSPMKAQKVDDRAPRFCALLEDWAGFCEAAGARGLVVILDEVDVEYASTFRDFVRRDRRQILLRELNRLLGRRVPLVIAFGSAPAADGTPENDAVRDLAARIPRIQQVEAPQPDSEQMRELGRRLCALYAQAYPDRIAGVDQRLFEHAIAECAKMYEGALGLAPRRFVRELLESLDVMPNRDAMLVEEA